MFNAKIMTEQVAVPFLPFCKLATPYGFNHLLGAIRLLQNLQGPCTVLAYQCFSTRLRQPLTFLPRPPLPSRRPSMHEACRSPTISTQSRTYFLEHHCTLPSRRNSAFGLGVYRTGLLRLHSFRLRIELSWCQQHPFAMVHEHQESMTAVLAA